MKPREKEQVMKRKDGGTEERKKGKKRKKKTKGKIGQFCFSGHFFLLLLWPRKNFDHANLPLAPNVRLSPLNYNE